MFNQYFFFIIGIATRHMRPVTHLQLAASVKRSTEKSPQARDFSQLKDNLIFLRHGERLDHVDRSWKGVDPPLSLAGRLQAVETALYFRNFHRAKDVETRLKGMLSFIVSSPFHRCIETALLVNIVAFDGLLPFYVDPLLSDWLQARVFRVCPLLRGHYHYVKDDSNIYYAPDTAAIRDELLPFLTNCAANNDLLSKGNVSKGCAEKWAGILERWCSDSEILTWTSPTMCESLYNHIAAKECDSISELYRFCGAPYPESKKDLGNRCQVFLSSQFLHDAAIKPWHYYIPDAILAAVEKERKEKLPSHVKCSSDLPLSKSIPVALLPPARVLAVTHADVISGMMNACCPTQRIATTSVPYCSMTVLERSNNFYCASNSIDTAQPIQSLPWTATQIGSLDALSTRIVLRFR